MLIPFLPFVFGARNSVMPSTASGIGSQLDIKVKTQFSTFVMFPSMVRMWPFPYAMHFFGLLMHTGQHSPRMCPGYCSFGQFSSGHRFEHVVCPSLHSHVWHSSSGLVHSSPCWWVTPASFGSWQSFGLKGDGGKALSLHSMTPLLQMHFLS